MIRLIKSANLSVLIVIPIIIVFFWYEILFGENYFLFSKENNGAMPFFILISNSISNFPLAKGILSIILLILQAVILLRVDSKYSLTGVKTFLPAIIFILIVSSFKEIKYFNPILFSSLFVSLGFFEIFATYKVEKVFSKFFNSGFLIAIASLFYFYSVFLIVTFWIAIAILRPFNWREIIASIVGLLTPYVVVFALYFVFNDIESILSLIVNKFSSNVYNYNFSRNDILFFSFLALLILISMFYLFNNFNTKKISTRQYYSSFIWFSLCSIGIYFFNPLNFELIYFIAIPFSILISNYFANNKSKWFGEGIFIFFLTAIIIHQFFE